MCSRNCDLLCRSWCWESGSNLPPARAFSRTISDDFSKTLYLHAKTFALKTAALSPEFPLCEFKCSAPLGKA